MRIKELRTKIFSATEKENFQLLNDLAWEYRFAYPDSTIYYSKQAYDLGKTLQMKTGLSRALNYIGVAYDKKGEPINAYEYYLQAQRQAEQQNDTLQIAYSNNNIGRLLSDQGLHGKALDYFILAKGIFVSLQDSSGLAYVYQSIGRIHDIHKDFKKAEDNFEQAFNIRVKLGNTRDIMAALVLLGILHQDEGDIDGALFYFNRADSAGQVINDRVNLAEIKIHLAKNYLTKGMLDSASLLSANGLQTIMALNAIRTLPEALLVRGEVLEALAHRKEAKALYNKALEISGQTKELNVKMRAHYLLWKFAEEENSKAESILHQNSFLVIQDSLKDLEVTRSLERYQFEIEIQKKDLESQLAKAEDASTIQTGRWQNIILSIVTFFTLIVAFITRKNNKREKATNAQLVEQNHRLEDLNHEKDTLMNIVAHDLKSPLNRINGLVHLIEIDPLASNKEQYFSILKKTTKSGLSLIADLLLVNAVSETALNPGSEKVSLNAIVNDKIEMFKEAALAKDIALKSLNSSMMEVYSDQEFLNRILENLISNAIKFSHPKSSVELNFGLDGMNYFISVKDSGPGFSQKDKEQMYQKFKRLSAQPTASESSNGLGLALIKVLIDRLGGNIKLISEERKGSEFIVTLPNREASKA